jgi:glycosyltransferase involved in cell wall biosynthesis
MSLKSLLRVFYDFFINVVTPLFLPFGTKRRDFVYRRWRSVLRLISISKVGRSAAGMNEVLLLKEEEDLCEKIRRTIYPTGKLPKVSVVIVLYCREKEIKYCLESLIRQDYPGEFEIILVDDKSTDNSIEAVNQYLREAEATWSGPLAQVHVLRNEKNVGNCRSRNIGIAHAKGDLIVVIDSDCVVNANFLSAHVCAHLLGDCEVAVGPMNIETNGKDPLSVLKAYESSPEKALRDCRLQDKVNSRSFLNCITRNFSIKKKVLQGELFDPLFSYSNDPASGFGWEDVEMGYSLYKRGARIKFIPNAFSLHVSHPPSVDERTKALRSLLNFRRLFEKHPELLFVSRRWTLDTYQKICVWLDKYKLPANEDRRILDNRFQRFLPSRFRILKRRNLKILTFRWHCPHQYELYKLPYEFTLATGISTGFTNSWQYGQRPLRPNVRLQPIEEINTNEYNLAIIHFDENILAPENASGVIPQNWGVNAKWFMNNLKMPMVAICHGTPQFYGQYTTSYSAPDLMKVIEEERTRMVEYFRNILVICNSYQAQREWGFRKSKVIWHGFDPTEFPPALYRKGVLTLGKAMKERPHYRGYFLYQKVFEHFPEEFMPHPLSIPEPHPFYAESTNLYAYAKFRNQVDTLREYSIYFNPTHRSPMPRFRGEAMMCGLVTVSANNHDVELFIKNGINGFYSNEPGELKEYLLYLLRNAAKTIQIGTAGRLLAMDIFNHDRYLQTWEETISEIIR